MAAALLDRHAVPQLRLALLELFAGRFPAAARHITADGWDELDRLAALHRLQPLLHQSHRSNSAVPEAVRERWREAFRLSSLRALALAGDLERSVALLEARGFEPIALKGAWLAWHAYPHPGLRPMRDIDLLLTPDTVIPAHRLLQDHGYEPLGAAEFSPEDSVKLDKHMPPLLSPHGTAVEVHHRLWEIDGRMDHSAPGANEAELRARARRDGGIVYLAPADLLAHLIIHAVYDHRLDCGPLVLSDIAYLLGATEIDWDAFWAAAALQGWDRGAQLVLALVQDHARDLDIPVPVGLPSLPPEHLSLSADLLLQELDTRRSAGFVAALKVGGITAMLSRAFARREHKGHAPVARNLNAEGGFLSWARGRLARTLWDLSHSAVRRQSRNLAQLSQWLDGNMR